MNNELILVDNIQFFLLVSIPSTLACDRLLQFMINSYAFVQQQHKNDDGQLSERMKNVLELERSFFFPQTQFIRLDHRLIIKNIEEVKLVSNNRLIGEIQYKITFNNHKVLYYFLNRFRKGDVNVKGIAYQVKILKFDSQGRALDTLFQGYNMHYIENQLMTFKNDQERVAMRFFSFQSIQDGLLHPSSLEKGDASRSSNTFDEMDMAKISIIHEGDHRKRISYQSLYVDLHATLMNPIQAIFIVDYMARKDILNLLDSSSNGQKKVKKKKEIITMKNQPLVTQYFNSNIAKNDKEIEDVHNSDSESGPAPLVITGKKRTKTGDVSFLEELKKRRLCLEY